MGGVDPVEGMERTGIVRGEGGSRAGQGSEGKGRSRVDRGVGGVGGGRIDKVFTSVPDGVGKYV